MYKLYYKNCLDFFNDMPYHNCIDLIVADIPFSVTACKWDKLIPFDKMWAGIRKLLKPNKPVLLFGIEPFSSHLRLSNEKWYKYDWIWEKNTGTNFFHAERMPIRYTENIHVFFDGSAWYFPQKTTGHVPTNSGIGRNTGNIYSGELKVNYAGGDTTRYPKNILKFDTVNNYERIHPSEKPVDLMEYLILTYSKTGDVVLDFTCGSGPTGIACAQNNRDFIGVDNGICLNKKSKYYGSRWIDVTEERILLTMSLL